MAAGTGALEALARLLGGALNELGPRLGTGQLDEIVADLGYDWSDEHTPADEVGAVVEAMTDLGLKLEALTAARDAATSDGATPEGAGPEGVTVDAGQPDAVAEAGVELLASIRAVLVGFEGLGTVMDSVLGAETAGQPGSDDARPFARALLDYLLIGYLQAHGAVGGTRTRRAEFRRRE